MYDLTGVPGRTLVSNNIPRKPLAILAETDPSAAARIIYRAIKGSSVKKDLAIRATQARIAGEQMRNIGNFLDNRKDPEDVGLVITTEAEDVDGVLFTRQTRIRVRSTCRIIRAAE